MEFRDWITAVIAIDWVLDYQATQFNVQSEYWGDLRGFTVKALLYDPTEYAN